ncbi:hypothetical protein MTP10_35890 [Nonomuraea sp. 3-1Str]|uniref:hypothetical protein n=1 Tax=Nonomuraea sp. 3-1Str TaxID=2929801 RepID=UPI00285FCD65|nr:hypothetical protein [Nonomuraea sp. 3-1Str]MDR8414099.1 hypothetical protein [Nonomuraea sp. 3-1Str]
MRLPTKFTTKIATLLVVLAALGTGSAVVALAGEAPAGNAIMNVADGADGNIWG